LASIFWVGVLGWQAAYAPTERQKQVCYEATKKTGHKTEECESFWERTTTDPVALFTLILAISTVGLWGATIFLYRAGQDQLRLARETIDFARLEFNATHRPKLVVREAHMFPPTGMNPAPGVRFVVANAGSGAADIVESHV